MESWSVPSPTSAPGPEHPTLRHPPPRRFGSFLTASSDTRSGIIEEVDAAVFLQEARRRSGLSRRQLAMRGRTSASTLAAYESGASIPSVSTLARLLRAAGFEVAANLRPVPTADERELAQKIEALFSFVDVLPRGPRRSLRYPVFGVAETVGR